MSANLGDKYTVSRENGTIYVRTKQILSKKHLHCLQHGAGELFMYRIDGELRLDTLMEVIESVGEVFLLRFKIDYLGRSRGFAYLQYIDDSREKRHLKVLQNRLRHAGLRCCVTVSVKLRHLCLLNVNQLSPAQVLSSVFGLVPFEKLLVMEYEPSFYTYFITYRNNRQATKAHHLLIKRRALFGRYTAIKWRSSIEVVHQLKMKTDCCGELSSNNLELTSSCYCFML